MRIKNLVLTSTFALSLIGSSIGLANQESSTISPPTATHQNSHKSSVNKLTSQQRAELHTILEGMREQMIPLLKMKKALKLQLIGKIATPKTQWKDIASLVNSINENNAKITILFAKTRLTAFQKLGVLLPSFNEKRFHENQANPSNENKHNYV